MRGERVKSDSDTVSQVALSSRTLAFHLALGQVSSRREQAPLNVASVVSDSKQVIPAG